VAERNETERNGTQRNATQRNATERNGTQRNATQRNASHGSSARSRSGRRAPARCAADLDEVDDAENVLPACVLTLVVAKAVGIHALAHVLAGIPAVWLELRPRVRADERELSVIAVARGGGGGVADGLGRAAVGLQEPPFCSQHRLETSWDYRKIGDLHPSPVVAISFSVLERCCWQLLMAIAVADTTRH
jgi:hypothetical protein